MTLAECRGLQKGDKVYINLGGGWRQKMTFLRMIKVTSFGKMTFSELMSGELDLSKGKDEWMAMCEYTNDRGRRKTGQYRSRALHKEET